MWTTQVARFGLYLVLILVFLGGSLLSLGHAKRERSVKSSVSRQTQIGPKALRPAALAALKTWEQDSSSMVRRKKTWRNH